MIGVIFGKEVKNYEKDGQKKTARTLYVLWEHKRQPDNLEGSKVESVFVNFDLPAGVEVGTQCEFEYELQPTKNGTMARLVDITPLQKMRVTIVPDVTK